MAAGVVDTDKVPSLATAISDAKRSNPYLALMARAFRSADFDGEGDPLPPEVDSRLAEAGGCPPLASV